jgi:hypothetical protein
MNIPMNPIIPRAIICASLSLTFGIARGQADKGYAELPNPAPHKSSVWAAQGKAQLAWGSTSVRYSKQDVPTEVSKSAKVVLTAWRGERVNAQAVLWTAADLKAVSVAVSELKGGGATIPASAVGVHFVRYVMTDELNKDGKGGCGHRPNKADWDSSLVADVLDVASLLDVQGGTAQPIWVRVWTPSDAKAGRYKGRLSLRAQGLAPLDLELELNVLPRTLPQPSDWSFHLDLWQNPYAVARYHKVPLWSEAHFDLMRPLMKMLAEAGQKVITTTIMHRAWNGQTEDAFESMVGKTKRLDGSWTYDYEVFDRWVEFMHSVGIDQQISCFTLVPWALEFDYYDQASNRTRLVKAKVGDKLYGEYWLSFLQDFARHLKAKGWFDKTAIAMDERPLEAMLAAIKVIRQADPMFKISLAGLYHPEIESELHDYCIAFGSRFPNEVKAARDKAGKRSTVYTCCSEPRPNTFTFSPPAEARWLGWHAMSGGYDGYLRWAYNSWTADPLRDSRFRTWAAGDCYLVYPDGRSSIRMELLIEGIQDYEKIRLLRLELATATNGTAKLRELNQLVSSFTPENLVQQGAARMTEEARERLNGW